MHMTQKRRIRSHAYNIAVTLHVNHERRLGAGGGHVADASFLIRRIFADINLLSIARISVIPVRHSRKTLRRDIEMFVKQVVSLRLCLRIAANVIDNIDELRIFFLQHTIKAVVALYIARTPVFVSNFNILERKRLRMPVFCTERAPLALLRRCNRILDRVDCALEKFFNLLRRAMLRLPPLAGHPAVYDIHSGCAQILAEL